MLANWPQPALVQDQDLIDQKPPTLLEQFQTGSKTEREEAFSAIYNRYSLPIWKYIYSRIPASESDAKDVYCEVWSTALGNLDKFQFREDARSDDPLRAWLFECATRRIKKYGWGKNQTVSIDLVENYIVHSLAGDENTVFISLFVPDIEQTANQTVYAILERLNEQDRTILQLRYYGQMSFREIGGHIGKREGAVRKRHHDILKKVRKFFEEDSNNGK